jgi:hypothetical protein
MMLTSKQTFGISRVNFAPGFKYKEQTKEMVYLEHVNFSKCTRNAWLVLNCGAGEG